ncbi:MAG TPA: XdhC family protein [Acidimicrobiia bacterium]|nr:XdhC family protein [Acidimicrobiia bacterium]
MTSPVLDATKNLIEKDAFGVVITVIAGPGAGAKAVLDSEAVVVAGSIPDRLEAPVRSDASQLMAREASNTLAYTGGEVFFEVIAPRPRLFVFGAVHIAQELVQHAGLLGFHTVVADPRPAFVTEERFPGTDERRVGWPGDVVTGQDLDSRTFVVVLTHDRRFEDPLWPLVLPTDVRYIGAMGSSKTSAARRQRLLEAGFTEDRVDRIHGPIGLDIGSRAAGEVAIAILGEMIAVRYLHDQEPVLQGRPVRL